MAETLVPKALARSLIYRSKWVNLWVDKVSFPNGNIIDQHHLVDFDNSSVMLVAKDEAGRYAMVEVTRYPTGRTEWEFPAGGLEPGEDPLEAARRELLEETGCRGEEFSLLYTYHPLNGISNKVEHIVRCRALPAEQGYDTAEINSVRWATKEEIWEMIRVGEQMDGYVLVSFLLDQHL